MRSMYKSPLSLVTLLICSVAATNVQSQDPVNDLKVCAKIADRDARISCYDALGEKALADESTAGKPLQATAETQEIAVTTEAAAAVPAKSATTAETMTTKPMSSETEQFTALLTSCKKGSSGRWYFYLDNGQVWQQVNNRRLKLDECNFGVTIRKVSLGHRMQMDGDDSKFRVSRRR